MRDVASADYPSDEDPVSVSLANRLRKHPVGRIARRYFTANPNDLAAVIAFNAMIALVPTALLVVAVAGLLFRRDDVLRTAIYASVWALPSDQAQEALAGVLQARRNSGWLSIISLIGFAWIGSNFLAALARAMNRVYRAPNREYVHQRLRGFVVIVAFGILLAATSLAATLPTLFVGADVGVYFATWFLNSAAGQVLSYGVSAISALAMFALLYRVVPNANQRLATVWPGTLFASVVFLILVQAFPLYIRLLGTLGGATLYGRTFLFVSLLVTWFYLLAHVVLAGTFLNAWYQRKRGVRRKARRHATLRSTRVAAATPTGPRGVSGPSD